MRMSVIVKGLEMPKACADCHLNLDATCSPKGYMVEDSCYEKRADWCPLIELQPHGRLIDADAFMEMYKEKYCAECDDHHGLRCRVCFVDSLFDHMQTAPTILEAEVEDG